VQHLLRQMPELEFSISATTRPPVAMNRTKKTTTSSACPSLLHRIAKKQFVEFEEVYTGTFYGTLRTEIERIWAKGKTVIFDIDVEGGMHLKRKYGEQALAIFVQPPSLEVLIERLTGRGTDSAEKLQERFAKAEKELNYAPQFDIILKNYDLETACKEARDLVANFIGA
jgi:guanylate kinase